MSFTALITINPACKIYQYSESNSKVYAISLTENHPDFLK